MNIAVIFRVIGKRADDMGQRPKTPEENSCEYDKIRVTLGNRLREIRQKAGLTQAQVGEMAGLTQSYVFEIETGGANITLKTFGKLADVLHTSARDFLPESESVLLSAVSLERLHALIETVAAVLSERQSQDAHLLSEIRGFADLRLALERSVEFGQSSPGEVVSAKEGAKPKVAKRPTS